MSLVLKKGGGDARAWYMLDGQDSFTLSRTPSAPSEEQTSWVIERQESASIPDLEKEIRFSNVKRSLSKCAVNSVYAAPLTTAYCQLGAILTASTQLALVRFRLDQSLCRSRYRCHGSWGFLTVEAKPRWILAPLCISRARGANHAPRNRRGLAGPCPRFSSTPVRCLPGSETPTLPSEN